MSERIEILRQRAREEAADAQMRRAFARKLSADPIPVPGSEQLKKTWFGAIRRTGGICGGDIEYAGQIAPDRSPCPRCGVRADIGCKHRRDA